MKKFNKDIQIHITNNFLMHKILLQSPCMKMGVHNYF